MLGRPAHERHLSRIVIPNDVRDLQSAAKCRSLTSFGMTTLLIRNLARLINSYLQMGSEQNVEKKSWLRRRAEGAFRTGLTRAYETVRVDPERFLFQLRAAYGLPIVTYQIGRA